MRSHGEIVQVDPVVISRIGKAISEHSLEAS
jgi:hypothetical protein